MKKEVKKAWSFKEVLQNPATKSIIEQLEWGCSDPAVIENLKKQLFTISGYEYKD